MMGNDLQGDLCRLTVIAPSVRIDVALPENVPLIDVVPVLVRHAGEAPDDPAAPGVVPGSRPSSTWSLQRLGAAALDTGLTPAELSLRDGEILYLRPRPAELPELAFDDVADAIATAKAQHSRRWTSADTRWAGLTAMVVTLLVAGIAVIGSGPPWRSSGILAAVISLSLTIMATLLSRSFTDARAGAVLGFVATGFAAVAGLLLGRAGGPADGLAVITAAGAVLVIATACGIGTASNVPAFAGIVVAAMIVLVVAAAGVLWDLSVPGAAGLAAALALGLTQSTPAVSLRLADLPLPTIPFTADDVRNDDTRVDGQDIIRRALLADEYVTALVGALMLVVAASMILLSQDRHGTAPWLLGVIALSAALRARVLDGRLQRLFLLAAAVLGGGVLALAMASGQSSTGRLVFVILPLLAASAAMLAAALSLPGHSVSPVWRRLLDVVDGLVVVSVVPLMFSLIGVVGYVRGLAG